MCTIAPDCADIDLETILVTTVPGIWNTACQADITDPELAMVASLPFALDEKQHGKQRRMAILPSAFARGAIHVVASTFGALGQHEIAA